MGRFFQTHLFISQITNWLKIPIGLAIMPIISHFFLELVSSLLPFHKGSQTFFLNVKNILFIFQKASLFVGSAEFEANLTNEVVIARGNILELLSPPEQVPQVLTDFFYLFLLGTR